MIFAILIIVAIAFFLCANLITNHLLSNILSVILAFVMIGTVVAMIGNFHYHWGMQKRTITTEQSFTSVNKQMNMILTQKIGTKTDDQVVIYKNNAKQNKPTTTKVVDTKNIVKKGATKNKLVVNKHEWVYKNNFYKMMFGLAQKETFISRTNTFHVANDYIVLTPKQAKQLGTIMKKDGEKMKQEQKSNPQAALAMRQQAQTYVQGKMAADMQKQPNMSAKQKQQLAKKYAAEYQQQAKAKAAKQMVASAVKQMNLK